MEVIGSESECVVVSGGESDSSSPSLVAFPINGYICIKIGVRILTCIHISCVGVVLGVVEANLGTGSAAAAIVIQGHAECAECCANG
mmetsp:Transcript_2714/g.3810  ORF Transcript_2714/g.3810 Transcript_2714/m.3810 type:complete len:87 (-) Transcript_2714:330-590(-)